MKNVKLKAKRLLAVVMALLLCTALLPMAALAEDLNLTATTMCLESAEKSVTVRDKSGKVVNYNLDQGPWHLHSGDTVETGLASYAAVSLDGSKAFKLAPNSKAKFCSVRSGGVDKLEVQLAYGKIFGDITEHVPTGQELKVTTGNSICGVVGTVFSAEAVSQILTILRVYQGDVDYTVQDNVSGSSVTGSVHSGQAAVGFTNVAAGAEGTGEGTDADGTGTDSTGGTGGESGSGAQMVIVDMTNGDLVSNSGGDVDLNELIASGGTSGTGTTAAGGTGTGGEGTGTGGEGTGTGTGGEGTGTVKGTEALVGTDGSDMVNLFGSSIGETFRDDLGGSFQDTTPEDARNQLIKEENDAQEKVDQQNDWAVDILKSIASDPQYSGILGDRASEILAGAEAGGGTGTDTEGTATGTDPFSDTPGAPAASGAISAWEAIKEDGGSSGGASGGGESGSTSGGASGGGESGSTSGGESGGASGGGDSGGGYDPGYDDPTPTPTSSLTIRFDANGGTGSMDARSATVGGSITIPDCAFTRAGYAFTGWNTAADGKGEAAVPVAPGDIFEVPDTGANTMTLYARWALAAPTITDNGNGTFTITAAAAGASLCYTTDGRIPATASDLYKPSPTSVTTSDSSVTVKLGGDTTIKAFTFTNDETSATAELTVGAGATVDPAAFVYGSYPSGMEAPIVRIADPETPAYSLWADYLPSDGPAEVTLIPGITALTVDFGTLPAGATLSARVYAAYTKSGSDALALKMGTSPTAAGGKFTAAIPTLPDGATLQNFVIDAKITGGTTEPTLSGGDYFIVASNASTTTGFDGTTLYEYKAIDMDGNLVTAPALVNTLPTGLITAAVDAYGSIASYSDPSGAKYLAIGAKDAALTLSGSVLSAGVTDYVVDSTTKVYVYDQTDNKVTTAVPADLDGMTAGVFAAVAVSDTDTTVKTIFISGLTATPTPTPTGYTVALPTVTNGTVVLEKNNGNTYEAVDASTAKFAEGDLLRVHFFGTTGDSGVIWAATGLGVTSGGKAVELDFTNGRTCCQLSTVDGVTKPSANLWFTMPAGDVTVSGEFQQVYEISTTINPEESGTLTVEADGIPTQYAAAGETVTLTATPDTDHVLSYLTVKTASGAVEVSASGSTRSFVMPAAAVTASAGFSLPTPTITDNRDGTFTITAPVDGASICYTVDGRVPATASDLKPNGFITSPTAVSMPSPATVDLSDYVSATISAFAFTEDGGGEIVTYTVGGGATVEPEAFVYGSFPSGMTAPTVTITDPDHPSYTLWSDSLPTDGPAEVTLPDETTALTLDFGTLPNGAALSVRAYLVYTPSGTDDLRVTTASGSGTGGVYTANVPTLPDGATMQGFIVEATITGGTTTGKYTVGIRNEYEQQASVWFLGDDENMSQSMEFAAGETVSVIAATTDDYVISLSAGDGVTVSGPTENELSQMVYSFTMPASDTTLTVTVTERTQVLTPYFTATEDVFTLGVMSYFNVFIGCGTDGAEIRYTTDGTTPTASSTLYNETSGFRITGTTTVKAVAFKEGLDASEVATKTFTQAYFINKATIEHGTVTVKDAEGNGISYAVPGATVYLTATPDNNYSLSSLSAASDDGTTTVPISTTNTFTMIAKDVTVSATFAQNTSAGKHGYLTVNDSQQTVSVTVAKGTEVLATYPAPEGADPTEGFAVASGDVLTLSLSTLPEGWSWSVSAGLWTASEQPEEGITAEVTGTGTTRSITVPAVPAGDEMASFLIDAVAVQDEPATWSMTVGSLSGGSVKAVAVNGETLTSSVTELSAAENDVITLLVTADNGYAMPASLTAAYGQTTQTLTVASDGTATLTMPAANVTVSATFALRVQSIELGYDQNDALIIAAAQSSQGALDVSNLHMTRDDTTGIYTLTESATAAQHLNFADVISSSGPPHNIVAADELSKTNKVSVSDDGSTLYFRYAAQYGVRVLLHDADDQIVQGATGSVTAPSGTVYNALSTSNGFGKLTILLGESPEAGDYSISVSKGDLEGKATFRMTNAAAGTALELTEPIVLRAPTLEQVATPAFNPPGDSIPFSVTADNPTYPVYLSCETDGATIYYTTDGSTPSATNGTEYTAAIALTDTTTIRAIAVKDGMQDSAVKAQTFIRTYLVTVPATISDGTVSVQTDDGQTATVFAKGNTVLLVPAAASGYALSEIKCYQTASMTSAVPTVAATLSGPDDDGRYSFEMPDCDVTVRATFEKTTEDYYVIGSSGDNPNYSNEGTFWEYQVVGMDGRLSRVWVLESVNLPYGLVTANLDHGNVVGYTVPSGAKYPVANAQNVTLHYTDGVLTVGETACTVNSETKAYYYKDNTVTEMTPAELNGYTAKRIAAVAVSETDQTVQALFMNGLTAPTAPLCVDVSKLTGDHPSLSVKVDGTALTMDGSGIANGTVTVGATITVALSDGAAALSNLSYEGVYWIEGQSESIAFPADAITPGTGNYSVSLPQNAREYELRFGPATQTVYVPTDLAHVTLSVKVDGQTATVRQDGAVEAPVGKTVELTFTGAAYTDAAAGTDPTTGGALAPYYADSVFVLQRGENNMSTNVEGVTFSEVYDPDAAYYISTYSFPAPDATVDVSATERRCFVVTFDPGDAAGIGDNQRIRYLATPDDETGATSLMLPSAGEFTAPEGMTFAGWLGSKGKLYPENMDLFVRTGDLVLTAQWGYRIEASVFNGALYINGSQALSTAAMADSEVTLTLEPENGHIPAVPTVTYGSGTAVTVTQSETDALTYTFRMPAGDTAISVTYEAGVTWRVNVQQLLASELFTAKYPDLTVLVGGTAVTLDQNSEATIYAPSSDGTATASIQLMSGDTPVTHVQSWGAYFYKDSEDLTHSENLTVTLNADQCFVADLSTPAGVTALSYSIYFGPMRYTITPYQLAHGTMGTVNGTTAAIQANLEAGQEVQLTFNVDDDWEITAVGYSYTENGQQKTGTATEQSGSTGVYVFTMPDADVTLNPTFASTTGAAHTITIPATYAPYVYYVEKNGESVTPTSGADSSLSFTAEKGDAVLMQMHAGSSDSPRTCVAGISWADGDGNALTVDEKFIGPHYLFPEDGYNLSDYTFDVVDADMTATLTIDTFKAVTASVPAAMASYGTLQVDPEYALQGANIRALVTPAEGYDLDTLTWQTEGGTATPITLDTNGYYSFTMPDADVTVTATFKARTTRTLSVSEDLDLENGSLTVTAYNTAVAGSSGVVVEPDDDGAYTVYEDDFIALSYSYPAGGDMEYGVCATSTETISALDNTRSFMPGSDNDGVIESNWGFLMPAENATVEPLRLYRAEIKAENGTVAVNTVWNEKENPAALNEAEGIAYVAEGETVRLEARPLGGYALSELTVLDSEEEAVDLSDNSFTMPEGGVTITATFTASDPTPSSGLTCTLVAPEVAGKYAGFSATVTNGAQTYSEMDYQRFTMPFTATYGDTVTLTLTDAGNPITDVIVTAYYVQTDSNMGPDFSWPVNVTVTETATAGQYSITLPTAAEATYSEFVIELREKLAITAAIQPTKDDAQTHGSIAIEVDEVAQSGNYGAAAGQQVKVTVTTPEGYDSYGYYQCEGGELLQMNMQGSSNHVTVYTFTMPDKPVTVTIYTGAVFFSYDANGGTLTHPYEGLSDSATQYTFPSADFITPPEGSQLTAWSYQTYLSNAPEYNGTSAPGGTTTIGEDPPVIIFVTPVWGDSNNG